MTMDDPAIRWSQATNRGILVDAAQDAWHSGHLNAIALLRDGVILVGAHTGGVWRLDPLGGTAQALSDAWDEPDITFLAKGTRGPRHIFAGGNRIGVNGAVFVTNTDAPDPLSDWRRVTGLPTGAGGIRSGAVIPKLGRIVLACDGGIYWSDIPPGALGGYVWQRAIKPDGSSLPAGAYSAVAIVGDAPAWGRWSDLGVLPGGASFPIGAPLSAIARRSDQLDLFGVDTTGRLWARGWSAATSWSGWAMVGGATFPPRTRIAAVVRGPERMELFGVATDGRVVAASWNRGVWSGWTFVTGVTFPPSTPLSAVSRAPDEGVDLFAVGSNGRAMTARWGDGSTVRWLPVGTETFPTGTPVAALERKPGQIDVFAVRSDGRVVTTWRTGVAAWEHWTPLGTATFPQRTTVTAVARKPEALDLFALGRDRLVQSLSWRRESGWGSWAPLFAEPFAQGTPVAAVARGGDYLDVFAIGRDNAALAAFWNTPTGWNRWYPIAATPLPSAAWVTAVARAADQLDLFAVNNLGRAVSTSWGYRPRVIAAAYGDPSITDHYGIFHGGWDAQGRLTLEAGTLPTSQPPFGPQMQRVSLAAHEAVPTAAYALSASQGNGFLAVLRTVDSGRTWTRCGETVTELTGDDDVLSNAIGSRQGSYNLSVAVAPWNPEVVAVGMIAGPMVSRDGGTTWRAIGWDNVVGADGMPRLTAATPHLHADVHAIVFDPYDNLNTTIYAATDGGLACTPDWGRTFRSTFNKSLPTLQFYPAAGRGTSLGVHPTLPSLVAGGTQDNNNTYADLARAEPWREIDVLGDGGLTAFLGTGVHLYASGTPIRSGRFADAPSTEFRSDGIIPIASYGSNGSARLDTNGLALIGANQTIVEVVRQPSRRTPRRHLVYAFAAIGTDVYQLAGSDTGDDLRWELRHTVPQAVGGDVCALGSRDGRTLFVGTTAGVIYQLILGDDSSSDTQTQTPVVAGVGTAAYRILVLGDGTAVAAYNGTLIGRLIRLGAGRWTTLTGGLPTNENAFLALELDSTQTPEWVFAATDSRVYVSRDQGTLWTRASSGLPARPHCAALRLSAATGAPRVLYLSTFGRSLWSATLTT